MGIPRVPPFQVIRTGSEWPQFIAPSNGGAGAVEVMDHGISLGFFTTLDFEGAGVTLAINGGDPNRVDITIAGGGGAPAGVTGDIQFNIAGAFGVDTTVFTYGVTTGWPTTMASPGVGTSRLYFTCPDPIVQQPTIYARNSPNTFDGAGAGSDVTGLGTFAAPYRTYQRAIQDVPTESYNQTWTVDISGIGTEIITCQEKTYRSNLTLDAGIPVVPFPGQSFSAAINVIALPFAVVTIAAADTAPVGLPSATQPESGLRTFTIPGAPGRLESVRSTAFSVSTRRESSSQLSRTTLWILRSPCLASDRACRRFPLPFISSPQHSSARAACHTSTAA